MLRLLRIRDFALIRQLEIEFGTGLNLLTGETGSGKSILVDALGLLLGGRASPEMVRTNCETAILEAAFGLDTRGEMVDLLRDSGAEVDEDSILIRREISSSGRSRVFINSSLATLSLLKALGGKLADIHGQHDRQTLLDLSTHLDWLDRFGANEEQAREVQEHHKKLREIAARLDSMKMDEQERLRRVDVLEFQLSEIRRANLKAQEKEALESERNILAHRERIFALATEAYGILYENESSLLSQGNHLEKILRELETYDASWAAHREALRDSLYRLEDLAYTARDYTSGVDFSPDRLDQVERRLAELERLSQKYGSTAEEILAYAEKCQQDLEGLVSYSDTIHMLGEQFEFQLKHYLQLAEKLSEKRRKEAARLERALRKEFQALSMEKMALSVHFHPRDIEAKPARIPGYYGPNGIDHVEFLVAPNKGEEMRPLAKIASGGELSRVMLAIRSLCGGRDAAKTLVFDEVDAGIGGRVAEAVGRRLRDIASGSQVLCVTHLPQIAAFADQHFRVHKEAVGTRTETIVKRLDEAERVQELARMLGGEIITETARHHAREMLAHSGGATLSHIREKQD